MPILANTHQTENPRGFSETGENKKLLIETFAQTAERIKFEVHGAQKPEFTRPLNLSGTGLPDHS